MVFQFLPKCRKFIWWMKQRCFGGLQYGGGGFRLPPHALKIMWTGGCLLGLLTATCLRSFLWSGWDWKWPRAVVAVCSCSFMLQNHRREQFVILKDRKVKSNVCLVRLVVSSPGPKLMVIFGIVLMIRTSYPVPWVFTKQFTAWLEREHQARARFYMSSCSHRRTSRLLGFVGSIRIPTGTVGRKSGKNRGCLKSFP